MNDFWKSYNNIVFDCDSTLCSIEGIDELARLRGKETEVMELTQKAMNGLVAFDDVFFKRLELIKPSESDLEKVNQLYVDSLVPDVKGLVDALHYLDKDIVIVSAGYQKAFQKLKEHLDISDNQVYANRLYFDKNGYYQGFDQNLPLWKNGGKRKILESFNKDSTIYIGDSVTDMETEDVVDVFIGYGGVIQRKKVSLESDIYVNSQSMIGLFPILAGENGFQKLWNSKYQNLCKKSLVNLFEKEGVTLKKDFTKILLVLKGEYYD